MPSTSSSCLFLTLHNRTPLASLVRSRSIYALLVRPRLAGFDPYIYYYTDPAQWVLIHIYNTNSVPELIKLSYYVSLTRLVACLLLRIRVDQSPVSRTPHTLHLCINAPSPPLGGTRYIYTTHCMGFLSRKGVPKIIQGL